MSVIEQEHIALEELPRLYESGEIGLGDALFVSKGHELDPLRNAEAKQPTMQAVAKDCGRVALSTEMSLPGPGQAIYF